jgi:hypothetical protein
VIQQADIFDLFNQQRREKSHLLIRGTHNRKVDHCGKYLHLAIRQIEASGTVTVEVKRSPEHSSRQARLTIRFTSFDIQVPLHHIGRLQLKPVRLQVILAEEENPPPGTNPISWLLITSLEINSLEDAACCVQLLGNYFTPIPHLILTFSDRLWRRVAPRPCIQKLNHMLGFLNIHTYSFLSILPTMPISTTFIVFAFQQC